MRNQPTAIDRNKLVQMLSNEFPEVVQAFDQYSQGLLHCEMGIFAGVTERAMDQGQFWRAEKYFRFIASVWERATPEVQNAIHVSYLEYLALGEYTDHRQQGLKRMPDALRCVLLEIDGRGRWL